MCVWGAVIPAPILGLYPVLNYPDPNPSQGLNTYYVQAAHLMTIPSPTIPLSLSGIVSYSAPQQGAVAASRDLPAQHLPNSSGTPWGLQPVRSSQLQTRGFTLLESTLSSTSLCSSISLPPGNQTIGCCPRDVCCRFFRPLFV